MNRNKEYCGNSLEPREFQATGYRKDFIRKRMLQKSLKGNEKGYKTLSKLPETIHTGMEVLWRQQKLCDVTLVSRDRKQVRAHRLILSTCSDYFYDLFADASPLFGANERLEIPGIDGNTLDALIDSMYSGKIKIDANSVDPILLSAHFLGMFAVLDACEEFLIDFLNKDNCLQLLATAFKFNFNHLTESALRLAADNFQLVTKRQPFRNMTIEHLISLLKRNDLKVENELEVFQRARSWIENTGQPRLQHAAEVMSTIRLPLLTPTEVIDNVECCSFLMGIVECQRLVKESLHYHLMPARQCLLQSPRTVPRANAKVCLIITGGAPRLETQPVSDRILKYDQVTDRWQHVTNMPEPRHHHAVAELNGFLYIAGGDSVSTRISPTKTVFRYDPRTGGWMTVAAMLTPRQSFQLSSLSGIIYAVGGRISQDTCLATVERYDPSLDIWVEVAPLSGPRRCAAVACLAGKLYAVGGSGSKAISSRVERYSPMENKWELLKPLSVPRFFAHLHTIAGFLYIVGGATIDDSGNLACIDSIERFSPAANQWTFVTKMRTPRSEFGSATIEEKIYVVGGYNWSGSKRLADVECFDTDTGSWVHVGEMMETMTGHAACSIVLYDIKDKEGQIS